MGGASSQVKPPKVILQGLDAAGKTTLLYKLKLGEIVTTIPTIGFNIETLQSSHLEVTAWDVGGRCPLRPLYRHFYKQNDGFIYMLDSADVERLDDAFEELNKSILKDSYDENRDKVVMVLANKQDLENALTPAEIETRLQMYLRKFTPDLNQSLDGAGKTTLLYRLKLGEVVTTMPTLGFNVETLQSSGFEVTAWDLGGRDKARFLHRHYYSNTDGFIFVLDSTDVDRLDDAFEELYTMILKDNDDTRDTVVMVLANKQDLENALTPAEIEARFQKYIEQFSSDLNLTAFVMPCISTSDDDKPMWLAFNHFVKMIEKKKEGTLENGFIPSAWETAQDQNKETTNDVTVFHRVKNSVFKNPFHVMKSVLFY